MKQEARRRPFVNKSANWAAVETKQSKTLDVFLNNFLMCWGNSPPQMTKQKKLMTYSYGDSKDFELPRWGKSRNINNQSESPDCAV